MVDIIEKTKPPAAEEPVDIVDITEITPEFDVSAVHVATLDNSDKIIHFIIPDYLSKRIKACSKLDTEFNKEIFTDIGLDNFIGFTEDDVFDVYPELKESEQVSVDEQGEPIMQPKFRSNIWNYKTDPHLTGYFVVRATEHKKYKATVQGTKKIKVEDIKLVAEKTVIKWLDKLIEKEIKDPEEVKI